MDKCGANSTDKSNDLCKNTQIDTFDGQMWCKIICQNLMVNCIIYL